MNQLETTAPNFANANGVSSQRDVYFSVLFSARMFQRFCMPQEAMPNEFPLKSLLSKSVVFIKLADHLASSPR
ncbi:MAG: hypothetical protein Q7T62_02095 [Undibacterium sp.]|nr:hypothetical protein [Undibacterium sp.]